MKTPAIVAAVVLAAWPAAANQEEAAALSRQAQAASEARDYARAAELFDRADALFPQLISAYDATNCHVFAAGCDAAAASIQRLVERNVELRGNADVVRALQVLRTQRSQSDGERCALVNRLLRSVDTTLGIELGPDVAEIDARSFAQQARRYYEAGDYARAAVLYETAHATYPILVDALFNAGMAYQAAGYHRESLQAFRRVVEQSPDSVRSDPAVSEAMASSAHMDSRSPQENCALAARLHIAIANAMGDRLTEQSAAARLFNRGVAEHERRQWRRALEFFLCCQEIIPHETSAFNAAVCYCETGEWTQALLAFDRYLAMDEDVAADETVRGIRREIEAEPYAREDRANELFSRLVWAIYRAQGQDPPTTEESR